MMGCTKKVNNGKVVAAYLRVSSFDQQKGLKSQERALRDYCKNHGFKNVRWYRDIITGVSTQRPSFDKLQADVFKGKVHTIVVWKLDRVSRKGIIEGLNILKGWLEKGIRIVSVTQQLDFSGEIGRAMAGFLFALAAMERENLRENTKRGLAAAKAKGVKLGKRPKLFANEIVPMLKSGLSISSVADKLGKTRQAIYNALKRDGVDLAAIRTG
jgi:DNA invertase Pin-like site-specific DNA recombinase